ncbi:hypothetical protein BH24ACT23_BH24ACT23_08780 [soil metagenome]
MGVAVRLRGPARARLNSEAGVAVPVVIFMMLAALAVGTVGAVASISVQKGTSRDQDSKEAFALADAGVSQALLHYNRVPLTAAQPCVASSGGALYVTVPIGGWCPPVSGSNEQGSFSYAVAPGDGEIEIVSTGVASGETRRVDVLAKSSSGQAVFADASVKSLENLTLDAEAEIRANSATNGNMILSSNARLCGVGSVGVGRTLELISNAQHYASSDCTGTGTTLNAPLTLPAVNQGDAPTVNHNGRFFSQDFRTGGNKVTWTASTRTLNLSSNSSVTLGGSTYSFCKLEMSSNTALYVAPGASVRIYFDSPEACGLPSGATQIDLSSNARITSASGGPANVALMLVGSDTRETWGHLNSNTQVAGVCEQNFVIYGPRTRFDFDSNSVFCGAIAAKSIHMDSNARFYTDSGAQNFIIPSTHDHYEPSGFVECKSAAASPPDAGC